MVEIYKAKDLDIFLKKLASRQPEGGVEGAVREIIGAVKNEGDAALNRYTRKFDGIHEAYEVPKERIEEAYNSADKRFINALENAAKNIRDFHERQKRQGYVVAEKEGVILGYRIMPLEKVGLYVPGGTAAYPSSVLMNAIPARIAGVEEIILITPPKKGGGENPDILAACRICGIDRVFIAGGAQGIAALAYGTQTIPKVDKIIGPGNIYVATAKKLLFGTVDIDMIAGPSEILIIADDTADPAFAAADMMSQAEHDPLSSSVLVTICRGFAEKVVCELGRQAETLSRKDIIKKSLESYGAIIIADDLTQACQISNRIAPEHLEIMTERPFELLGLIKNAGSVFLGSFSPEPLGDYYAGPNHVLPTNGTARFFSSLGVDSFVKRSAFTCYSEAALRACGEDIIEIAEKEGLSAHANSVSVRLERK